MSRYIPYLSIPLFAALRLGLFGKNEFPIKVTRNITIKSINKINVQHTLLYDYFSIEYTSTEDIEVRLSTYSLRPFARPSDVE